MLKKPAVVLEQFLREDSGQDLVEYALLLVFLALAAIAGLAPIRHEEIHETLVAATS